MSTTTKSGSDIKKTGRKLVIHQELHFKHSYLNFKPQNFTNNMTAKMQKESIFYDFTIQLKKKGGVVSVGGCKGGKKKPEKNEWILNLEPHITPLESFLASCDKLDKGLTIERLMLHMTIFNYSIQRDQGKGNSLPMRHRTETQYIITVICTSSLRKM